MAIDWKAYLKPSLMKIAIAALFFILFAPFINCDNGIRCIRAPCPSSSLDSIFFWLVPLDGTPAMPHVYSLDFPILIGGAVICYLAGCKIAQIFSTACRKAPPAAVKHSFVEELLQDFQEFFKPTVPKIQLALVLFVLCAPLLTYDNSATCAPCPSGTVCPACQATKEGSLLTALFSPEHKYQFSNFQDFEKWGALVLSALVSYVLASYLALKFAPWFPKPRAKT